tara:strand:- start:1096 stop:1293 length:198 start_codon:yes stop_codon:yes gene_type:complete
MQKNSGERLSNKQTIMNVFIAVNDMKNIFLPLIMSTPDVVEVLTSVTIVFPLALGVIKVKEVNTG